MIQWTVLDEADTDTFM